MVATSERKGIAGELPSVGTPLTARYKKRSWPKRRYYTAQIVEVKDLPAGRAVKYRNQIFTSLSAAAKAITHCQTNGWPFWHLPKTSDQ